MTHWDFCRRLAVLPLLALAPLPALAETCAERSADAARRIALCEAEAAAAADPYVAAIALGYKAEAQRMSGALDEAAATLALLLRMDPKNPWYWVEQGNVRFDLGDAAGAVGHYSTALELDPGDTYARLNRADGWWELHAPDRCLTDSTAVVDAEPQNSYALLVHARCLTDMGRASEALDFLDRLLAQDPGYLQARAARLAALLALGRGDEVVAGADAALAAGHEDDAWAEERIRTLRLSARAETLPLDQLQTEAETLAGDYPDSLAIPAILVGALVRAGRLDDAGAAAAPLRAAAAREARGEAALRDSGDPAMEGEAYAALGRLDLALGQAEAARASFGRALVLSPGLARSYTRRLSEMGFLPLSATAHDVLKALDRCLEARKAECRIAG